MCDVVEFLIARASQVTAILRTNEKRINDFSSIIKKIECNQLASNHPIEDRLRIASIHLDKAAGQPTSYAFGVFDGHGGGLCADVISRRLYHYIALALAPNPKELIENNEIEDLVKDVWSCPDSAHNKTAFYDDRTFLRLRNYVLASERQYLLQYAAKLQSMQSMDVESKLKDAFNQCDSDLADEVEFNLTRNSPNLLLHFYTSLAVSGCCANLLLVHDKKIYVCNTGAQTVVYIGRESSNCVLKFMQETVAPC